MLIPVSYDITQIMVHHSLSVKIIRIRKKKLILFYYFFMNVAFIAQLTEFSGELMYGNIFF